MAFIPFVHAQVASGRPIPVNFREREALELDGFSAFSDEVTPEQRKAIVALAVRIVQSQSTNDPIFEFRIEGFADIVRDKPNLIERKFLEDNMSLERAQTGFDLLVQALKDRGGAALADRLKKGSRAFGLGTQRLKVPNATTEAEFKRNRRVVFIVRQVTFIPPPPTPAPPPSSVIEDRFTAQLLKAASISGNPFKGAELVLMAASLRIIDRIAKRTADFDVKAAGAGFGGGPLPVGGSISASAGPVVPFKTFRLIGRGAGNIGLESFAGDVTVFVDASLGSTSGSAGGTLSFVFDALHDNGANTQPEIIRLPSGGGDLIVPGVSSGDVMKGRMSVVSGPTGL